MNKIIVKFIYLYNCFIIKKQQCESDLKVVLVEMEKQKSIMNERMKKLQDAFLLS